MFSIDSPRGDTMPTFAELSEEFESFTDEDLKNDHTVIDWLSRALKEELRWDTPNLPDRDYFAVVIGRARGLLSQAPPTSFPTEITLHSNDPLINAWMDRSVQELYSKHHQRPTLPPDSTRRGVEFGAWLIGFGIDLLTDPNATPETSRTTYGFFTACAEKYL